MNELVYFGNIVRRQLVMNKDSQQDLAFTLGISPSNLCRILNGKYNYGVKTYFMLRRYVNGDLQIQKPLQQWK